MHIFKIFNNREIATAIWLIIIFAVFILFNKNIRQSLLSLIKAFFHWKILLSILAMIFYVASIIILLCFIRFWDLSLLKDTIFWFCFSGIVISLNAIDTSKKENVFKRIIIDNIKLIIILEFIIASFTFSLVIELIIIPVLAFVVLVGTVAEMDKKHKIIVNTMNVIQIGFGFLIISLSIINIIINFKNFGNLNTLRIFFLPIILTISILPFIYFMILIANYEMLFLRIKLGNKKCKELKQYAKRKIFKSCFLSIKKTNKALNMGIYNLMNIRSKEDVDEMEKVYKKEL